ncbi:MAG: ribose ABC transporter permease [Acidobacteria bacterium]|nr:ribose ABC transporter permease [Acidobacteriota bacterium]
MKLRSGMLQKLLPFLSLIGLFVFLSIASPYFLTATNLASVVRQTAVINIMALGMTLIIVSGGIDLSVGAILAFSGVAGTMAMAGGQPIWIGLLVGVVCGTAWGLLNGLLTTTLRIPPFIVTLGTLGIARGVTLILSGGLPITGLPPELAFLGEGMVFGVPFVLLVLLATAGLVHVTLDKTKLGRYTYAIGSNVQAAVYAGIPVARYTVAVYAISGALCGLASLIEASRLMTGQPTAGQGYELQVIAAVVIGGGSLTGGEGSVAGTLVGAFIMGLLANGSDLLGINPYLQQAIIGGIIILAVALDEARKRRFAR